MDGRRKALNPAGLPPDSRHISPMNSIRPVKVEKHEWLDGEMQAKPLEVDPIQ